MINDNAASPIILNIRLLIPLDCPFFVSQNGLLKFVVLSDEIFKTPVKKKNKSLTLLLI